MNNKISGLFKRLVLACSLTAAVTASPLAFSKIYVYNWTEYIPTSVLKKFTEETGIEVVYSTYESSVELYSKLKLTNGEGYDLIVPSDYYIDILKNDGLIQKIDKSKISNYNNVLPSLLSIPADPNNDYSLSYAYGLTSIGYDSSKVKASELTSWNDLWSSKFKGDLSVLNDMRDLFSMALLALGKDPNATDQASIEAAYKKLQQLIPSVVAFNSDAPEVPLLQEETIVAQGWNGSFFRASLSNPNITTSYPKEGAIFYNDVFAIPTKAKNLDEVYKFIDFILRPEIAFLITEEMGFPTSNSKVIDLYPTAWKNNVSLNPSKEVLDKAHMLKPLNSDDLALLSKYFNLLKIEN